MENLDLLYGLFGRFSAFPFQGTDDIWSVARTYDDQGNDETYIEVFSKFCRRFWGESLSRETSEYPESCLTRLAPSLGERSGDVNGDMNVLLLVPEDVCEGVKRLSRLDFEGP